MGKQSAFDRFVHRAVAFPNPAMRLSALQTAYEISEEQLAHAVAQQEVRAKARLGRQRGLLHPDDIEAEKCELEMTVTVVLPKVFRSGLLISIWTAFEASVKDMAEYTKRERKLPFGLQELRGADFTAQMERFFKAVLDLDVFPEKAVRRQLEELRSLRNVLVHHDGSVAELPKALKARDDAGYSKLGLVVHQDLHHSYVIPDATRVAQSLALIRAYLEELSERVYDALHPIAADEDT